MALLTDQGARRCFGIDFLAHQICLGQVVQNSPENSSKCKKSQQEQKYLGYRGTRNKSNAVGVRNEPLALRCSDGETELK